MIRSLLLPLVFAPSALVVSGLSAQSSGSDIRDELLRHFEMSSRKVAQLSSAMPESLYGWSPSEGIMSVATVYAHIARYNFMYLADQLGIPAPDGVDVANLEAITDKARIVELVEQSIDHVVTHVGAMSEADLVRETRLYGRDLPAWKVLVQLVTHMNEHVGQSVAYARMNGIVPPWSS